MEKINVNISWSGDNYCAGIEYLGVVVVTNKFHTKLYQDIESSFKFHSEGCIANGDLVSENISAGNYEFVYTYEVSALLHKLDGIVTRAAIARATGINERQIGHYASGLHTPRAEQRIRIVEGIRNIGKELISVE
jgi:hypothetical protein